MFSNKIAAFFFIIVGLAVYSNVITDGAFLFDDFEYVIGNPIITDLSSTNISDPRQVGYFTFALNYALGGEDPLGYHLFNIIVHIANGLLLFLLFRTLVTALNNGQETADIHRYSAFLAALIFIVHPVQTQAVSYVTQRFTSLASFFYILAVYLYLKARSRIEQRQTWIGHYAAAIAATVLAMKTKEIAFTLPFILLLFEALVLRWSGLKKRRFIFLVPFAVTLVIIPLSIFGPDFGLLNPSPGVAGITRVDKIYDLTERSSMQYLFTQFRAIVVYVRTLLLPVSLRVVYDFPVSRKFFDLPVIASFIFLLSFFFAALYSWRKGSSCGDDRQLSVSYRIFALAIFWFFITLSVESSVIPIKDVIFEHRVYLPSVGFFMAGAVVIVHLSERLLRNAVPLARLAVPALFICLPLAFGTYIRNEIWTDEVKLWDDVVQKSPNKPIGYNNRGMALAKRGDYKRAIEDYDRTISYFPKNMSDMLLWENADMTPSNIAKTYAARGDIYAAIGNVEKARADYKRAKDSFVMPVDIDDTLRLADLFVRKGAFIHALEEYNKILQWDPENIKALNDRANTYSRMKRFTEAIGDFTRIIAFDPDFVLAHHNRGIARAWSGDNIGAIADFKKACAMGFEPACESIELVGQQERRPQMRMP